MSAFAAPPLLDPLPEIAAAMQMEMRTGQPQFVALSAYETIYLQGLYEGLASPAARRQSKLKNYARFALAGLVGFGVGCALNYITGTLLPETLLEPKDIALLPMSFPGPTIFGASASVPILSGILGFFYQGTNLLQKESRKASLATEADVSLSLGFRLAKETLALPAAGAGRPRLFGSQNVSEATMAKIFLSPFIA